MSSMLKNDFHLFFSRKNWVYGVVLVLMTLILWLFWTSPQFFDQYVGLSLTSQYSWYQGYFVLVNLGFVWLGYFLFFKEIESRYDTIFLRIDKRKWIVQKLCSIAVLTIVSHVILFLIYLTYVLANHVTVSLIPLIEQLLWLAGIRYLLQLVAIGIQVVLGKYGFVILVVLYILMNVMGNIAVKTLTQISFFHPVFLIIEIVVCFILSFIVISRSFSRIMERSF